ncbi:MAG TPA: DoxX family protein [Thermoanaerobaculia bacterium]|nr:DoxX family protein [Thermoanaerobaculia bacterium]
MNRFFLSPHADRIYALLRIVAGFMFLCHGLQKLFGVLGGQQQPIASLAGVAGVIEFVAGVLIMVGFLTHWAAFLASGTMAVAYFMVHQPQGTLPIQNQGELAALYCFVFLYIAARGSGPWSVDASMRGSRR